MHKQSRKLFTQTLFIGEVGFWGGFFALEITGPNFIHPPHPPPTPDQRRRNDNINKICVFEGVGEGEVFTENCPKTLFFQGNPMTIKFGNYANFIVRDFVVIWEAPT